MRKAAQISLAVLAVLVLANLLALDYFWWQGRNNPPAAQNKSVTGQEAGDTCGSVCQKTIAEKIQTELDKSTPLAGQSSLPTSPPVTKCALPTASPQAKTIYIPLASQGSTTSTSWTDMAATNFYFNLADYPGVKEVRFETHLLAVDGASRVYARLYDATNKRGVDFSDLSTQNQSYTRLESSAMKIWQGNNLYVIQFRSESGIEAQLKEGKLKIIF